MWPYIFGYNMHTHTHIHKRTHKRNGLLLCAPHSPLFLMIMARSFRIDSANLNKTIESKYRMNKWTYDKEENEWMKEMFDWLRMKYELICQTWVPVSFGCLPIQKPISVLFHWPIISDLPNWFVSRPKQFERSSFAYLLVHNNKYWLVAIN